MATLTVRQLRERLADLPGEAIVVLARDGAGSGFSSCPEEGIEEGRYLAETACSGLFYDGDDPDLDEDLIGEGVRAICLWPTN